MPFQQVNQVSLYYETVGSGEPLVRHLDAAQTFVRRRKGSAVFFGRFTAALRVLVPGLAGMSEVGMPNPAEVKPHYMTAGHNARTMHSAAAE